MADFVTNKGKFELFSGDANFDAADLRVLLLTTAGAPTPDTNFVADIVANEVSVGGYARQTLTGETITEDDANDFVYLDANDPTFAALLAGQTVGWMVLFRHTGADATAPVYACYDLTDTPTNGSDVTVQFAAPASGGALKGA